MKKLFTLFFTTLFILSCVTVNAQSSRSITATSKVVNSITDRSASPGGNSTAALWDIQFSTTLVPINVVSVVYTGTEFWVSRYTTDTMYTLDNTGAVTSAFRVTGVGSSTNGIRGLTYDGTNIFATVGNNKVVYKIDPVTKTLVGSNTATALPFNLRGIAFDSTANGGAGGFWVSNFGTGFYQISRTGAILDSIGLASHALAGVYGVAYDPYTAGGPYIWAHDQDDGTRSVLNRVNIATGLVDLVMHDINPDFGSSAIAGSVSITWRYNPGTWTIMGIGQQAPSLLFAYELNDYVQAALDASADSIEFNPPYTIIPNFEVVPYSWTVKSTNNGSTIINDLQTSFRLTDSITDYFAPPASSDLNVATGASVYNTFGPFTPAMGFYYMQANANTGSQTDVVPTNDTLTVPFLSVGDSVYARDNSIATSALGIGDGIGGTLGQYFTLDQPAYITSATFYLTGPTAGDLTSVDLYSFFSGTPQNILATSPTYTFTAADTNGVEITLPFSGGPYLAMPGDYFLGVNEVAFNVTLGRTAFNYRPMTTFVTFTGQPWAPSEEFGFPVTYILRLNIDPNPVNIPENASSQFSIFPNPSNGMVYVSNAFSNSEYEINVFNNVGQLVYQRTGQTLINNVIDLTNHANGVYQVQIKSDSNTINSSIVISHN
jgi:hypothetical protein